MQSKITTDLNLKYEQAHRHFLTLVNKLGIEQACSLLGSLCQESEPGSKANVLKHLASKYFSIKLSDLTEGNTHWHSQVRSVCFYILNKEGLSTRTIGHLFSRREGSVHRQIKAMESIVARPSIDKVFFKACSEVMDSYQKSKIDKKGFDQLSDQDEPTVSSINEQMRARLKLELERQQCSIKHIADSIKMPRQSLSEFINGKQGLKTHYFIALEKKLNIKLI